MKYNCALIGLGNISKFYINAIQKNEKLNLYAVCNKSGIFPDEKKFSKVLKFNDFHKLLKDKNISIIVVATPNNSHFEIVKQSLEFNKHVLCEKPLGISFAESKYLIDLAEKKNCFLKTIFHRRYNKFIQNLKIDKKNISIIYLRYLENISNHSESKSWYKNANYSGGGCVIDNGVNALDLLNLFLNEIKLTNYHLGFLKNGKSKIDMNAFLEFNHALGKAFIQLDWDFKGEVKDLTIFTKDNQVFYIDLLKNFSQFKESLWHEYENAINESMDLISKHNFSIDSGSLFVSEVVSQIYSSFDKN